MKHLYAKITLWSTVFLVAAGAALCATYVYGAFFQHARYWEGTIQRVERTEIAVLRTLLNDPAELRDLKQDPDQTDNLLSILDGKLALSLTVDNKIIASNRIDNWGLRKKDAVSLGNDFINLTVSPYRPPKWHKMFIRWIKSPTHWLEPGYNHITAPFIAFMVFSLLGTIAALWRWRAAYLENSVMAELQSLKDY